MRNGKTYHNLQKPEFYASWIYVTSSQTYTKLKFSFFSGINLRYVNLFIQHFQKHKQMMKISIVVVISCKNMQAEKITYFFITIFLLKPKIITVYIVFSIKYVFLMLLFVICGVILQINQLLSYFIIIRKLIQMSESALTAVQGLIIAGSLYGIYKQWSQINKKSEQKLPQEAMNIEQIMKKYSIEFNNSKALEKIVPRGFQSQADLEAVVSNLYYRKKNSHLTSLTKSISEPIWDLLDRGGKRWRPILCMLIAQLYGKKRDDVYDIAALCQIIHNGTLIVDDIEDSSTFRRNKQCVHLIYGVDISVNAGNFMYFAPMLYLLKSGKFNKSQILKIGQIYVEEMTNLHIGQGWDILWHNIDKLKGNFPTQNDYLQMTSHKTGVLARLSARLVCCYLNLSEKQSQTLSRLAQTMGVAFQIQDDLLNLEGQQFAKGKGYSGQDIHEGKVTLMVLHFLKEVDPGKRQRMIEILKKKTQSQQEINEAIQMLRQSGSLQYAKRKMHELVQVAWKEAQENLPNNIYRKYMYDLLYYGIKRNK